jgi:hypothetical protein
MQIGAGFTISCSRSGPPSRARSPVAVRCPTPICERSVIFIRNPFDEMNDATPGLLDPHAEETNARLRRACVPGPQPRHDRGETADFAVR